MYNIKKFNYKSDCILLDGNNPKNIWLLNGNPSRTVLDELISLDKTMYSADEIAKVLESGCEFNENLYFEEQDLFDTKWVKLYLNLTYQCNLACEYCFVKNFNVNKNQQLTIEKIEQAIKIISTNYPKLETITLAFYGGEPLMCFDLIDETLKMAEKLEETTGIQFTFSMNTNGLLLSDDKIDYLIKHKITTLVSCDGPDVINNISRFNTKAEEQHTQLIKIINKYSKKLQESNSNQRLLVVNVTLKNDTTSIKNICDFFVKNGVKYITYGPIIGKIDDPYVYKEDDFVAMKMKYEDLFSEALQDIEKGIFYKKLDSHYHRFKERLLQLITQNKSNLKLYPGCNGGRHHFTLAPDGTLYACPVLQFSSFTVGNLELGLSKKTLRDLEETSVNKLEDCKTCWNKYFCGGGCYAMNYFLHDDIIAHDFGFCEFDKFLTEKSIYLLYEILNSDDRSFHDYIIANYYQK